MHLKSLTVLKVDIGHFQMPVLDDPIVACRIEIVGGFLVVD